MVRERWGRNQPFTGVEGIEMTATVAELDAAPETNSSYKQSWDERAL